MAPWQKPWKPGERRLPENVASKKPYRGGNSVYLSVTQTAKSHSVSHPPDGPRHGADDVALIGKAGIGLAGWVGGDQPQPRRLVAAQCLDAPDR